MRASNIKTIKFKDGLAQKKRNTLFAKIAALSVGILVLLAGAFYFIFFSAAFKITVISADGLSENNKSLIVTDLEELIKTKKFKYLEPYNNILFFNTDVLEENFRAQLPVLSNLRIEKKYPHELYVKAVERKPYGIWCFKSDCKYFDEEGVTWGTALKSSGFILMAVTDERTNEQKVIAKDIFENLKLVHKNTGGFLRIKNFILKDNNLGDFTAQTVSFPIYFSSNTNLPQQLDVLKIFWEEKSKKTDFSPTYLDLRVDGRVYFK